MTSNIATVINYRFGYLDCSTKHNMLARRNVVSVFFQSISIFQRSLLRLCRCFRLKVRGERLKAMGSFRFALNFFRRFIYLLTPCVVFFLAAAGSSYPLAVERSASPYVDIVELHSPFGKRNVGARRCCLRCRSYKLSFCALQLLNASGMFLKQVLISLAKRG